MALPVVYFIQILIRIWLHHPIHAIHSVHLVVEISLFFYTSTSRDEIPSSTAASVTFNASSSRFFFSFISGSVVAPILITATPPSNFRDVLEAFLYRNQNLSLNQGAFTAHTFSVPRILLTTKVANASSSTSSDIIINGLPDCAIGANITEN